MGARDSPWRQGHLLTDEAAIALGLIEENAAGHDVALVVTHDCDLASDQEVIVEIMIGSVAPKLKGDLANAKNARRLGLEFDCVGGPLIVEVSAARRRLLEKVVLFERFAPRANTTLSPKGLQSLQWWLSARYRRAAFPDAFEHRLRTKKDRLRGAISSAMEPCRDLVRGIYFLLDDGEERDRQGADDLYELGIYLLYDHTQDPEASQVAEDAAEKISDAFEGEFLSAGAWKNIRLLFCEAISDAAMTVAQERELKEWRLDHLSLESDTPMK
jgi:hypothetical protein